MSIKERIVSGYFYAAIFTIGYQLIILLSRIFLYRILTPSDFGIYNVAIAFAGTVIYIGDLGISSAIIQREGDETEIVSTGTSLTMVSLSFAYLLLILSTKSIANAYNEDNLIPILFLLIITQMLNIAGVPSRLIAQRDLEFKRLYITDLLKEIAAGAISLYCALQGFGLWSLIYGRAVAGVLWLVLSLTFILNPFHPRFRQLYKPKIFSKTIAADLIKLGFGFFMVSTTIKIIKELIPTFTGLLLDFEAVGILSAVLFLIFLFESYMSLISDVTFSAFSRIQENHSMIQKGINQFFRYSLFFSIPYFVILSILGDSIIEFIFGKIWVPPRGMFPILSWIVLILPFGYISAAILKSLGKTKIIIIMNILRILIFILVSWVLINSTSDPNIQLLYIALAILLQYIIHLGLLIVLRGRFLFFKQGFKNYTKLVVSALFMSIWLLYLHNWIHNFYSLLFCTLTSLGIFYAGLYIMGRNMFHKDMKELIQMITGK